ncbi:MAG TPA: SDR family NAD(P)-dependent oxidoreductase [Anaerolineales bacterium]|nr:SDR family NAD(P)-dependent oxidoreductase [Anaerolineales bacterium]
MIRPLRGANALLTGGSQGLGPLMARQLAEAGVNLAISARSADKLEAVAQSLRDTGARVIVVPADVTVGTDRVRLLTQTERVLGPIDILINNAGMENNGRYQDKSPAEITQLVDLNVTAPMLLTRAALPAMLERRRGHIVNLGSLAGKLGLPWGSVYGGTKAAIIAWSQALSIELEGSGVSVSVVSPGYVSDTGMFAVHGRKAHPILGESKPEAVARAVVRVLETGAPEIVVNPTPFGPLQALHALAPGLIRWGMNALGINRFIRETYVKPR